VNDTIGKTFTVAFLLCIACSVLVSSAAVVLRPTQEINKTLDKKRNILMAAGLFEEGRSIDELFKNIKAKVVDLETGQYVDHIDPDTYDEKAAAKDPEQSIRIPPAKDLGGIKRREKFTAIYMIYKGDKLKKVILPVYGKGLWSTLYGFIALDAKDLNTIRGLVYYQHGETPGLGGEVDNPNWKAQWNGKEAFGANGDLKIEVLKGKVDMARAEAKYQVDGLSGSTITSRGVKNMVRYWLGADGFGPYLARLKEQGA